MVARYEEQLRTLRREAESEASSLQGNLGELQRQKTLQGEELMATLRTLSAEKEESERSLMEKLKQQEAAAEQEKAMLRSRADRLSRLQDQAIAAGGSTKARAMLYWESMKSKTRLASSIPWRGRADAWPGAAAMRAVREPLHTHVTKPQSPQSEDNVKHDAWSHGWSWSPCWGCIWCMVPPVNLCTCKGSASALGARWSA